MNHAQHFDFGNTVMPSVKTAFNLCAFVSLWLCVKNLCGSIAFVFFAVLAALRRITPLHPLRRHTPDDAAAIRERNAALSGIHRAIRGAKVSIQQFLPCLPPVISAEVLHSLQYH